MISEFDFFGQPEIPYIILCNPNKEEIYSLGLAYNTNLSLKFNTLSEFSFMFPKSIDGGITIIEAYTYIQDKRLVLVEGYGYFVIADGIDESDGSVPVKNVTCKALEVGLIHKTVVAYGGTKPLYNILSPQNTILWDMIQLAPTWSVGTIDPELLTKFRTFDISNSNIYNFLMEDVAKAFECVFFFDTVTKTISAKTIDNATTETDIFLSFDNTIKQSSFAEMSDEITTCMAVYGGGILNIRSVNPLGSDKIYDFSYYANANWMSQGLVTAINNWETLIDTNQALYASNLLLLQTYNGELLVLQSTLATLNEEYLALEGVQKVRIQQGLAYADITAQMVAKQAQIDSQETLIINKQLQITTITSNLQNINTLVSFSSNFTSGQLLELDSFIFQNTYKNENIIQTDTMTLVEVQNAAQNLYNQAQSVLGRISQPRYEIEFDSVNYPALSEFSVFTNQTELGCIATVELDNGTYIESVLLEVNFAFDDPSNFTMTFSNRVRLDGANFTYSDLVGEVVRTGSDVAFDSMNWSNWEDNYKDNVTTFISSALNTTTNNLISNSNQEIVINQNGLRARNSNGAGGYSPKQAWLVNNVLAFSDDGFLTSKLALGEITLPTGGTAYGLVGDVIVGRILAGNTLTISNSANNFVLDQTGATLNNAKFSIQTTNTKIIIDPTATNSFRIQKNQGGTFVDKFVVNNTGDVVFSGTLSGANGTFSGTISATIGNIGTLIIDSNGLKTADGINYLRGNGDFKWGGLSISGASATFDGTIFANKIVGQVNDGQIASGLNAGKMTFGSMSGNRLFGGTATLAGINPSSGGIVTFGGGIGTSFLSVSGGTSTFGNSVIFGSSISIGGSITVSGGSGTNTTVSVNTPVGVRYLQFSRGVLVGVSS